MKRYMEHNKIPHTGVGKSTTEDSKARFPNVPLNQILGYSQNRQCTVHEQNFVSGNPSALGLLNI